eukprot:g2201.t1
MSLAPLNLNLSNNEIDDDKECCNLFVRLAIEQPTIVYVDFADNGIHADSITMLCNNNSKHQADQSSCHCLCEKLAHTMQQGYFAEYKAELEQLIDDKDFDAAEAKDKQGRTLLAIVEGVDPESELSDFIRTKTLFLGVYKIAHGDPAHKSATCVVSLADDFSGPTPVPVALKFMRHVDQFARELEVRKRQDLNNKFVVSVLRGYSSTTEAQHLAKTKLKSSAVFADVMFDSPDAQQHYRNAIKTSQGGVYEGYKHCLVLPRATKGLHETIAHDHIAGVADRLLDVKAMAQQIGEAVMHLHDSGVIHGDLKPLNVMHDQGRWKLIDMDAASEINGAAGLKFSTGYAPPELLVRHEDGIRVRRSAEEEHLVAHRTFDIWSFGALLYLLVTGQTLFHTNQEDNVDSDGLERLLSWDKSALQRALCRVQGDLLARDILQKLLQPDPAKRPQTFEEVCTHPFFSSAALIQTIKAITDGSTLSIEQKEQLNFLRLSTILFDHVTASLATLFVRRWDQVYPQHPWESSFISPEKRGKACWEGTNDGKIQGEKNCWRMKKQFSKSVMEGNPERWDMTLLSFLLLDSSHQLLDNTNPDNWLYRTRLTELRNLRNQLAHAGTCRLSDEQLKKNVECTQQFANITQDGLSDRITRVLHETFSAEANDLKRWQNEMGSEAEDVDATDVHNPLTSGAAVPAVTTVHSTTAEKQVAAMTVRIRELEAQNNEHIAKNARLASENAKLRRPSQ